MFETEYAICDILRETGRRMTPKQYADAIDRLGLSQVAAGRFLGINPRQSRRWIAGDARVSESAAKLLRLMIKLKLKPADVT
jgi:DNA-binding transcriptional regulator YiaG